MSYLKEHPIKPSWIIEKADPKMDEYAEAFAKHLANYPNSKKGNNKDENGRIIIPLTSSQLRKFFGAVKKQQVSGFDESEIVMLRPKLAYAYGRIEQKENGKLKPKDYAKEAKILRIKDFKEVIDEAIKIVLKEGNEKAFKNFINFFEAVVAYHKVYGKDNEK